MTNDTQVETVEAPLKPEDLAAMEGKVSEEATEAGRAINIKISPKGEMGIDFDGDFKIHEVFGMLTVSMMDLMVKNFMLPYFKSISKTVRDSGVDKDDIKDIAKFNEQAQQLLDLVNAFKNIKS